MPWVQFLVTQQAGAWTVSVDREQVGFASRAAAMKAVLASAESATLHGEDVEVLIEDNVTGPRSWRWPGARSA